MHLIEHIRRFGPAALFATEAFESFNAVIRAKSVHSNRHAPSRDIARAFAHGNRIRHLLSGARILIRNHGNVEAAPNQLHSSFQHLRASLDVVEGGSNIGLWCRTGKSPLGLVARPNIVTDYLGFDSLDTSKLGHCVHDNHPLRPYATTLTGQKFPLALSHLAPNLLKQSIFRTCKSLTLYNGDACPVGHWVLLWVEEGREPVVARVCEIIQWKGSPGEESSSPDGVLLEVGAISGVAQPYHMPAVRPIHDQYHLVPAKVC